MPRRTGLLVSTLLVCCSIASALNPTLDIDQYAHKTWTVREGFLKGAISSIAQTPDGYLWLGTEFGLLRFDGLQSVSWQPPANEHLPSNNIVSLMTTRDGDLWIGTDRGLASWKDGKLTEYRELTGQGVTALIEDREGTLWAGGVGTPAGRLCEFQRGSSRCYGEDGSLGQGVLSMYEDSKGNLWAGAANGLWRWKPGPPKLYPIPDPGPDISGMIEGDKGELLIAMKGGIEQLVDGKLEPYGLPGAVVPHFRPLRLLRDRDGGLWIGTVDRGLLHMHQGRTDGYTQPDGLSGEFVYAFFEDREANIWVATPGGLDRFRDLAVPAISVKQGLSNSDVLSVLAASDGSVWLSTRDGLNRWNNGQVTIYRKGGSGLPDEANSLFQDGHGQIWVSTARGLAHFDNGRFIAVSGVPGGVVHSIVGDAVGNLWIGNQDHGLFHFHPGSVVEQTPWASLGRKDFAYALLSDPAQGGLWLGFYQGGVSYFRDGQVRASYSGAEGLGEGRITGLQLDRDDTLWAATQGGLSRVKNGRVATLTRSNGLPCDVVHWAMEDDDHEFWLYTACGLVRIARSELDGWIADPKRVITFTVFDSTDGVNSHAEVVSGYSPRVAKSTDGKLWFVTDDGVSVIDPRHLPVNKLPPPVHIEQVIADRTTQEASSNLRLPPLTRDLEIDYTALSLVAPEKNLYRVKLEGWDRDWVEMGNERKKFYNNLPPRHYRFRVMASNNSGVWNETGDTLEFSILPAYYQTRWFQALCGIAGLALLWGLYRLRLYQIAREFNLRLDERVQERTRMARDLHDTLLQSFQGLMLRLQVVDDQLPPGKLKDQFEQTLERADQAIAEGRTAVYDLRSSATVMNDLAEAISSVANELARDNSAEFRLVVEGPVRELHPIIRDEIYRLTHESLRNAFEHAHAGHIETEIAYGDRAFRLRIRDDGQGIPAEFLERGRPGHFGLQGMRERARQIGAKFDIWSGAGTGTEIELTLPASIAYQTAGFPTSGGRPLFGLFRKKAG